jgi:hypothetical protein
MTTFYKEFTFIMLCACVLVASVITTLQYGAQASYKERRYDSCVETQFTYSKVDIETAKSNCRRIYGKD